MRRLLAVAVLTAGVLAGLAGRAQAQTIGPVCFKPSTTPDTFVLFYNFRGPNHLIGTGRNLTTGSAVTSTAIITGATVTLGILSPLAESGTTHTAPFSAKLGLDSLSGPGRCESWNSASACATGTAFTLSLVNCPANALLDDGADPSRH